MSSWKNTTLFSYVLEHLPVFFNICYKSIKPLIPAYYSWYFGFYKQFL